MRAVRWRACSEKRRETEARTGLRQWKRVEGMHGAEGVRVVGRWSVRRGRGVEEEGVCNMFQLMFKTYVSF